MEHSEAPYQCQICHRKVSEKTNLVDHLREEHEALEVASYAAATMVQEQDRDKVARLYYRQFQQIKEELVGSIG